MTAAARRNHRRRARTGGRGAVRDAATRRSRRARDQDRAAGRRRFRARLRHDGQRAVELFRVAQPIEGIADARSRSDRQRATSSRGCSRGPTSSCRISRRAPPTASGRRRCPAARTTSAADRLQLSGYGVVRPVRDKEGVRPARAERGRAGVDHRHAPTRRPRSASRSPTSPPACMRTPAS